ncbi:MAG TPA: hypothetical protein VGF67_02610 [Ktedonobacteraceae bacterium]
MNTSETNATRAGSKQRVQFDFAPEALSRLEQMQEKLEAATKAEVVRNALKLYEWLVSQVDPDSVLEVQDKEGKVQFRIPVRVLLS